MTEMGHFRERALANERNIGNKLREQAPAPERAQFVRRVIQIKKSNKKNADAENGATEQHTKQTPWLMIHSERKQTAQRARLCMQR